MTPDPAKLFGPLCRTVRADKPIPDSWREPLVELMEMLVADRDPLTSIRAVRVVIEMAAADIRQQRRGRKASPKTAHLARQ